MSVRRLGVVAILATGLVSGCSEDGTKRVTGQNEVFCVDPHTLELHRNLPRYGESAAREAAFTDRPLVDPRIGDPIQYNDDVVSLQVLSVYLDHVPRTLLDSRDIIVFAEVWENGANGYSSTPLNSVVHIARNQMVPGRLSFEGNLGYGPTIFKGHPLKVRFTVMILQKQKGQQAASAADVIGNFATAATIATPYSAIASSVIGIIREVLRSQPDIIALDFEFTGLSNAPQGFKDLIAPQTGASGERPSINMVVTMATETTRAARAANPSTNTRYQSALDKTETALEALKAAQTRFTNTVNSLPALVYDDARNAPAGIQILSLENRSLIDFSEPADKVFQEADALIRSFENAEKARKDKDKPASTPKPAPAMGPPAPGVPAGGDSVKRADDNQERDESKDKDDGNRKAQAAADAQAGVAEDASKTLLAPADANKQLRAEAVERVDAFREANKKLRSAYDELAGSDGLLTKLQQLVRAERPPFAITNLEAQWPWLRYGMYSIVETAQRRPRYRDEDSSPTFSLGLDEKVVFDRGWLVPRAANGELNTNEPLATNYIVFAITPHQLAENDDVLRAASQANSQLLTELRQSQADLKSSGAAIQAFGYQLARRVVESRADVLARKTAQELQRTSGKVSASEFTREFDRAFTDAMKDLGEVQLGDGATTWITALRSRITSEWVSRINEHTANVEPAQPPKPQSP